MPGVMNELDFNKTCPGINKAIGNFKSVLDSELDRIVSCMSDRDYSRRDIEDQVEEARKSIAEEARYYFEEVRKTNEQMREAADKQISDLVKQLEK